MRAVLIVENTTQSHFSELVDSIFESFQVFTEDQDIISLIYMDPPDLILIDGGYLAAKGARVVREFRSNTIFGHVPVVALMDRSSFENMSWQEHPIDDYILTDDEDILIKRRIEFISQRAVRELDMNPLTRLPGNESIIRYIQSMFDAQENIAITWVDIDNFKPFNDCYGFSRGDEVLVATGRIITNAIKELRDEKTFLGHIGGDDFVYICPEKYIRSLCEEVISRFDMVIRNFYNDDDLEAGGIISTGRDGTTRKFPIMTISLAVVINESGHYTHYGQASQDATDIKKYIKEMEGSNYMIDRRVKKR